MPEIAIPLLALAVSIAVVLAYRGRARLIAAIAITAWWALSGALAEGGALARFDARPPPLAIFMGVVIAGGIGLGVSRLTAPLLDRPLAWLVGFHAFRLPLELVLDAAARAELAPTALTFRGYNVDIITGAGALILAPLVARGLAGRRAVMVWNAIGLACLAVIGAIAVATAPFVRALGDDEVNAWVAEVPYVWLPAILVVAALAGHVVILRKLALAARAGRSDRP